MRRRTRFSAPSRTAMRIFLKLTIPMMELRGLPWIRIMAVCIAFGFVLLTQGCASSGAESTETAPPALTTTRSFSECPSGRLTPFEISGDTGIVLTYKCAAVTPMDTLRATLRRASRVVRTAFAVESRSFPSQADDQR